MSKKYILNCLPYYLSVVIILIFFGISYISSHSTSDILLLLAEAIVTGVLEELIFRGLIQGKIEKKLSEKKKIYSIFIAAFIFGVVHMSNMFQMDYTFGKAFFQSFNALMIGLLYGSIYFKDKKLIHVMILHSVYDFAAFMSDPSSITVLQIDILDILLYFIALLVFLKVFFDITGYNKNKTKAINIVYWILSSILLIGMILYFTIL